ncbi:hypothetical protein ABIS04_11315 [Shewanella sp. H8]|uniref:hypothetical protein n=1 Tax=Shewanella sp. H8 TaxID=3342676 RepID=UPI003315AB22
MTPKFKVFSLSLILFMVCACSSTPPIVVHDEYGEMLADNELFVKEASECALKAKQGVSGATLTQNSEKHDVAFASIQLFSFFSENDSCIKSKGWRIKE